MSTRHNGASAPEEEPEDGQREERRTPAKRKAWAVFQALLLLTALALSVMNALHSETAPSVEVSTNMLVESQPVERGDLCHEGGVEVLTGMDININAVLDEGEITSRTHVCNGPVGLSGPQGQPGISGASPEVQTVQTTTMDVGHAVCPQGGTNLTSGLDLNGNGELDPDEVLTTNLLCNGASGINGTSGLAGTNGSSGPTALVDKQAAPSYVCSDGFVIRFGIDDGLAEGVALDGVLQSSEVRESLNVCFSPLLYGRVSDLYGGITNSITTGCDAAVWLPTSERLMFAASHADHGCEAFLYDPSTNQTALLKEIHASGGSEPGRELGFHSLAAGDHDRVFFDADDGVNGRQLWVSDGTEDSTRVLGLVEWQDPLHWADGLLFHATNGSMVWTNGSSLVTVQSAPWWNTSQRLELEAFASEHSQWGRGWWLTDASGLWFTAVDVQGDVEPHRLALNGTITSWNVNPTSDAQLTRGVPVNGDMFVVAQRGTAKQIVHLMDNGTLSWLTSIAPSSGDTALGERMGLNLIGDNLVFDAQTQPNEPRLWTTHLPSGLSVQLSTTMLAPGLNAGATVSGGHVVFDCTTPEHGTEVCITDATTMGTRVVHDTTPGMLSSDVVAVQGVGEGWVAIVEGTHEGAAVGASLWTSTGSTMNLAYNPWPGSGNDSQAGMYGTLVVSDTQLFFVAHDGESGHEWHRWSHGELSDDWIVFNR